MEFDYKKALQNIPHKPGVYQYFDEHHEIIYIGKAKDLRNRVGSYFHFEQLTGKTKVLVKKIRDIKFTIVDTEIDAWLLENVLIKKYKPRYNVLLKDDKTYPSLCIKKENFPRVFSTRTIVKDGSTYLGPYASTRMMYTILELIKTLYPLRNCNLALTQENIQAKKFKVCLEYQIGNCKGPCEGYQSEDDYLNNIKEIREILKGNIGSILQHLKQEMKELAKNMKFEKANLIKEKIEALENYQSKSTVVSSSIDNVDVFSISSDDKVAFVNFLKVQNGTISQTQTIEIRKKLDESDEELLSLAIVDFRDKFNSFSREIIVPFPIDFGDEKVKVIGSIIEECTLLQKTKVRTI
jgi:excinuclease ABC subunit C